MFNRFIIRLFLICLLVSFGIFFGVDIATHGIERIHGPLEATGEIQSVDDVKEEPEDPSPSQAKQDPEPNPKPDSRQEPKTERPEKPKVTVQPSGGVKLAEQTGNVIQSIVHGIVEWIVSIFNSFL